MKNVRVFAVLLFIFTICFPVHGEKYQHDYDEPKEKGHLSIIDKELVVLDKNAHIIRSYGWSFSRSQTYAGESEIDDGLNMNSVFWYDHGMMEFITNWTDDD